MNNREQVRAIREALANPRELCDKLGLLAGPGSFVRQSNGVLVRCPWHQENSPSCHVRLGKDGTVAVHCFGCDQGGDALSLVAAVRGMNLRSDFKELLTECARLGGLWAIAADLEDGRRSVEPMPIARTTLPQDEPERDYPSRESVADFWRVLEPITCQQTAGPYLTTRSLDPERVASLDLARVIPDWGQLPPWAKYQGRSWRETGHALIVPMWDSDGQMRSVRAWRVTDGESPKRLPPSGYRASGLVMADQFALAMLRGERQPMVVAIQEGEPNWMSRCVITNDPSIAVIGIVSGSWTQAFANKVPLGAKVSVRTDNDAAGDRYAADVIYTLKRRAFLYRAVGD